MAYGRRVSEGEAFMSTVLPSGISAEHDLCSFVPEELTGIDDPQRELPRIAKNPALTKAIDRALAGIPTSHSLHNLDSRRINFLEPESVHLVVTSPPYWTLKEYRDVGGQLGWIKDYEAFLREIDKVWRHCFRALVPGGRLICVVGDVCLSRRRNNGRHTVVPLHASIQEHCRSIGFDNLAPIIWKKIANVAYEAENSSAGFLGKPYEPNAVIKNDIEFVVMQRKPGGYRNPSVEKRILSLISAENYQRWFQQVWTGITGASTRYHPAPYPVELAGRLIRMFSFVGDTILDPFMGTASTQIAAAGCGRNSIGVEVDPVYFDNAVSRMRKETNDMSKEVLISITRPLSQKG